MLTADRRTCLGCSENKSSYRTPRGTCDYDGSHIYAEVFLHSELQKSLCTFDDDCGKIGVAVKMIMTVSRYSAFWTVA